MEVVTCRIGTITVKTTAIVLEEPGDLTFTIPNKYRHVVDRNANTWTIVQRPDEIIGGKFSFLYSDQAGGDFPAIWKLLDGTSNITFVVVFTGGGGTKTHTFYKVTGSAEFAEATDGSKATVSFEAAGYSDGNNTYGKVA